jgi:hypothetical protein
MFNFLFAASFSASFGPQMLSWPLFHLPFGWQRRTWEHFRLHFCEHLSSHLVFVYVKDAFCFQFSEKIEKNSLFTFIILARPRPFKKIGGLREN